MNITFSTVAQTSKQKTTNQQVLLNRFQHLSQQPQVQVKRIIDNSETPLRTMNMADALREAMRATKTKKVCFVKPKGTNAGSRSIPGQVTLLPDTNINGQHVIKIEYNPNGTSSSAGQMPNSYMVFQDGKVLSYHDFTPTIARRGSREGSQDAYYLKTPRGSSAKKAAERVSLYMVRLLESAIAQNPSLFTKS